MLCAQHTSQTVWIFLQTCCTSAAVLLNSSMYRLPRISLCFFSAFSAYSSQENKTNASPVGLPSGKRTNSIPSVPSVTGHDGEKNCSTCSAVAVNGNPRMRTITWFSRDRNFATSLDVPVIKIQKLFICAKLSITYDKCAQEAVRGLFLYLLLSLGSLHQLLYKPATQNYNIFSLYYFMYKHMYNLIIIKCGHGILNLGCEIAMCLWNVGYFIMLLICYE